MATAPSLKVEMPVTAITRDKTEHRCVFAHKTAFGNVYECDGTGCKTGECDVYVVGNFDDNTESA